MLVVGTKGWYFPPRAGVHNRWKYEIAAGRREDDGGSRDATALRQEPRAHGTEMGPRGNYHHPLP